MFNIVCFILIKLIFNRSAKVGKDLIKRVETNNPVYFLKRQGLNMVKSLEILNPK
jgi:hypothetical protein